MRSTDPLSATLDAQRRYLEFAEETVEKSSLAPERLARMQEVEVGQTPSDVVYRENKLELLHYRSQTDEQYDVPILVAYALINKPYILDLQPDRSVIRRLLEAGHDVYLIDWNEPSRLDQHLTLADYIDRYIDNCVDVVRERSDQEAINVLGYCMGGTMAAIYAALYPEKVNALGLMAAGLCFDDTAGTLELWGDDDYFDPREITETFGNMPGEFLDVGFAMMDPVDNYVSKYVRLYDNLEDEDFVENFGRMEKWLSEGIDVAGEAYAEFLEHFYQGDELVANEFYLDGRHVDVTEIDMPVLQILGEYDHLVPAAASKPFNDVVGSDDVTTIEYPTGHIGLSVSGSSHENVWPQVAEWYADRLPAETEAAEAAEAGQPAEAAAAAGTETDAATETAETAEEGAVAAEEAAVGGTEPATDATDDVSDELEAIDGIGPTYADRLREAGIESAAALADADAETVAEITGAPGSRVEGWLEQARSAE